MTCEATPQDRYLTERESERIAVASGNVETIYESQRAACVGVVTASPVADRIVSIHGPEDPRRTGVTAGSAIDAASLWMMVLPIP
ncbi:MAG: hypothetical protein R3C56_35735 [Pirellulaceae bacterium]